MGDDDEIAEVAIRWGAQVHRRSPQVSKDSTTSLETLQEFLDHRSEVTMTALIQCTSPVLNPDHLRLPCSMMRSKKYDSIFSVIRTHFFRWSEVGSDGGATTKPLNLNILKRPRRQDWPGELVESGSFYFSTRQLVMSGALQGGRMTYYEMPGYTDVDIDYPHDWKPAEQRVIKFGYRGKKKKLPIKAVVLNADDVLFDSQVLVTPSGEMQYSFNRNDIDALQRMAVIHNINILFLTKDNIPALQKIVNGANMTLKVVDDRVDMMETLKAFAKHHSLDLNSICFIDIKPDESSAMFGCGYSATTVDADADLKSLVDYVSKEKSGHRAVHDILENFINFYL